MNHDPIPFPADFAAEERRQMLEDSQPLSWWRVFLAFTTSLIFWAVLVGLALGLYARLHR
jgi:hypothetical protein